MISIHLNNNFSWKFIYFTSFAEYGFALPATKHWFRNEMDSASYHSWMHILRVIWDIVLIFARNIFNFIVGRTVWERARICMAGTRYLVWRLYTSIQQSNFHMWTNSRFPVFIKPFGFALRFTQSLLLQAAKHNLNLFSHRLSYLSRIFEKDPIFVIPKYIY